MGEYVKTWWGRRFIEALESFSDPRQLARGRQYLGSRRIIHWRLIENRVEAEIRGHSSPYYGIYEEPTYRTRIELAKVPPSAWNEAITQIGAKAGFVARLLFNEMPAEIDEALARWGVGLMPHGAEEFRSTCTCDELEPPCKHVAGLCYLLAARFDHDPFLLFELRGLSRAELIRQLRETPLGGALAAALTDDPEDLPVAKSYFTAPRIREQPEALPAREFWRGAKRLPLGVEQPQAAAVPGILVRKGGDFPPFWDREDSFVDVMSELYEQVRKKAKDWM